MSDIWFVCKKTDKVLELGDCLKCEEPKNCLSRACYEQGRLDLLIELKEKHHIDLMELYPEMKGDQK